MIKSEDRERIAARLPEGIQPVQELVLYTIAEAVQDVRQHNHETQREDWYCMNLVAWMGERMSFVLKRLIDEAAEADALRKKIAEQDRELDKLYALEAAGVDNWVAYDYAMDLMREARQERGEED